MFNSSETIQQPRIFTIRAYTPSRELREDTIPKYLDTDTQFTTSLDLINAHFRNYRDDLLRAMFDVMYLLIDAQHVFNIRGYITTYLAYPNDNSMDIMKLLEADIKTYNDLAPQLLHFIAPSLSHQCAALNVVRTICRRTERKFSLLIHHEKLEDPKILEYAKVLNRLGSYIFAYMRYYEYRVLKKQEKYFNDWTNAYIDYFYFPVDAVMDQNTGRTCIYTRAGDSGQTSTLSGQKTLKCSNNVELTGLLDELQARLGYIVSLLHNYRKLIFPSETLGLFAWVIYAIYEYQSVIAGATRTLSSQTHRFRKNNILICTDGLLDTDISEQLNICIVIIRDIQEINDIVELGVFLNAVEQFLDMSMPPPASFMHQFALEFQDLSKKLQYVNGVAVFNEDAPPETIK